MDRDKTDAVVLNADVLFPVSTAFVRRTHIDRADQLMQDIAIQLLDTDIGSRLFNTLWAAAWSPFSFCGNIRDAFSNNIEKTSL